MRKLLLIFLFIPVFVSAQTAKEYVEQADSIYKTGKKFGHDKEYEEAMALYTKAIAADSTFIEAYRKRARASGSFPRWRSINHEALIADYTSVIRLNPKDIDAYENRAREKHNTHDLKGSIDDYRKLIEIDPINLTKYYKEIGELYIAMSDYTNAEKNYTLSIASGNENYEGRSYVRNKIGNYQGALNDYLAHMQLHPSKDLYINGNDHLWLGKLYTKVGNYKAAIENYTQAIAFINARIAKGELYQSEFEVINPYEKRAEVEILAGNYKKAMVDYNTAIKFDHVPSLYNGRAELKNKTSDKAGACNDWNTAYKIAAKTLTEWKSADSLRNTPHYEGGIRVMTLRSNRNTSVDTLGLSAIIINIRKYCK